MSAAEIVFEVLSPAGARVSVERDGNHHTLRDSHQPGDDYDVWKDRGGNWICEDRRVFWTPEGRCRPWRTDAEPPQSEGEPADTDEDLGLRACDLSDLRTADIEAPQYVVEPLIPRGYLTLFGSHGGLGKSTVGLVIGAHVTCGRDWAGLTVNRGRVMFISYEDNEKLIKWRLKSIAREYVLDFESVIKNMRIIDATKAPPIAEEHSSGGVKRLILTRSGERVIQKAKAGAFDLVIIDNASDAYGGDENQRQQVRTFCRHLQNAVSGHDGAVMLKAHVDKNAAKYGAAGNSYSGSTQWHNSARSRLALVDDQIVQEKLNVGKKLAFPIQLAWVGAVPVPTTMPQAVAVQSARDEADDATILACFAAASEAGNSIPQAETGPHTYVHALVDYAECTEALKADKARIKQSVNRLLRSGRIRREKYRTTDRKDKVRLVLKDCANARQCT